MDLEHDFTVPMPVEEAWTAFNDLELIAPCFPGAVITSVDGDDFTGTAKIKLGPIALMYAGKGTWLERDEAARRVVIEANGKDKRGNGTAGAVITAHLREDGEGTRVVVHTDLKITGRPAQFGRSVIQDVGSKILDQFASCLSTRLGGGELGAVDRQPQQQRLPPLPPAGPGARTARRPDPWRVWCRVRRWSTPTGRRRGRRPSPRPNPARLPGPPRVPRRPWRPRPPCRCHLPRPPAGRRPSRPPPSWTWATSWARSCCAGSARSSPRARSPR